MVIGGVRRLSKVARELNVGISTIVEFIHKKGYVLDTNPNNKVSDEIYEILLKEFSYYVDQKRRSEEIRLKNIVSPNKTGTISSNRLIETNLRQVSIEIDEIKSIVTGSQNIEINKISDNELIKNNPKVFISYSWDNEEHKSWIESFSRILMKNGIVTILDQYELSIGDNLQYFMEKHIPEVDKVIIILTPNYKTKAEKKFGGVGYEYSIITQELFNNQNSNKFIPIQREGELEECAPTFLKSRLFLDMRSKNQFKSGLKQIIYTVYNKRIIEKPELGTVPDFKNLNLDL